MDSICITAPAKINLTLDVVARRPDGFHDIESVMHQVSLCDTINITRTAQDIVVQASDPELPGGPDNLAYRAARLILDTYQIKTGLVIEIAKNIPVGAGLAGGSTNAAAVILGLNRLLDLKIAVPELMRLGESLGSDVPFCVLGGTALARGRGEQLTPVDNRLKMNFVLVNPGFSVSTALVYQRLDRETITDRPRTATVIAALEQGDVEKVAGDLGNVMELVTERLHPEVGQMKKLLAEAGAMGTIMSGSGPTVLGVFPDHDRAKLAYQVLKSRYAKTYLASSFLE